MARFLRKGSLPKLFLFCLFFSGCSLSGPSQDPRVCIGRHCVNVEIAQRAEDLKRGLQFREHLEENEGMLFIFDSPSVHYFWMKDTRIPLDMIWIDEARKIIFMAQDVQPCKEDPCPSYGPDQKANYVLEVNGGFVKRRGIQIGDTIEFRF